MAERSLAKEMTVIEKDWMAVWPDALADWSPFIQLHAPTWCYDEQDETREALTESFAMIRLKDHSIVISLRQVHGLGLAQFGPEILAHEVGHHVLCPGDLTDHARLLARVRRGLPTVESYAPYVCNLYADLLINDHLQRSCGRSLDQVYKALPSEAPSGNLWLLYMRMYEVLWNLDAETLTPHAVAPRVTQDALLGARLIRVYAKDWLQGAGRFACLCFPYVVQESERASQEKRVWCDTVQACNDGFPHGLTEIEEDELLGNIHPAEDPMLTGLDPIEVGEVLENGTGHVESSQSGRKSIKRFREPWEYAELLTAAGVQLGDREIAMRYYQERAIPFLIPFPIRYSAKSTDPLPEGIDLWELGSDLDRIDWHSTLLTSPSVIPGVTTRERAFGDNPGHEADKVPLDLYVGIDSSGSMRDPARTLSYPVLAGTVVSLSALRAGASVKAVLSGEPGKSISTDGFVRKTHDVLHTMVSYLGTGYAFGIHRLAETFHRNTRLTRPVHILIVSDIDMFTMMDETVSGRLGWDVARHAIQRCQGGATYVLQMPVHTHDPEDSIAEKIDWMKSDGWSVCLVNSLEDLVQFARDFSRTLYPTRTDGKGSRS
ncbi:MAG: hypothetical protein ACK5OB_04760 [Pirellula sp.]